MSDKLEKNLNEIRSEARSMLDTVEAVRGKQYAEVVRMLLNVKQAVHLTGVMTDDLVELYEHDGNREVVVSARDVMADLLSQIAHSAFIIADVQEAVWSDAIKDADAMMGSVHGLIDKAMYADRNNGKFGGGNAR